MITPPASPAPLLKIPKLERDNIPDLLKGIPRWVDWRAGPLKPTGKFDKIPCDPVSGRNVDAQNPKNWLTYEDALAAYDGGVGNGIGIVLNSEHRVSLNGIDYILVALDLDNCKGRKTEINELGFRLGRPYVEVSPSCKGLRIFALSTKQLKGGNDGNGHELYCNRHFVTVTGQWGRGKIKDATACLVELDQKWFGTKSGTSAFEFGSDLPPAIFPETEQNIVLVRDLLSFVSSDTSYETWRNIVWSVLSAGWACAEQIAREWSMNAPHRYDDGAFQTVVKSFDPNGGITLGTLHHHAEVNGWTKPAESELPLEAQTDPTQSKRLLTAEEVKALPNLPYRVKGLLPAKGLATIYGEPSSGKSFLALDLALKIAGAQSAEDKEREWFGMPIKPAPVIYIALEGRSGVSKRIKAWEAHNSEAASPQIRFLLQDFGLLERKDSAELAQKVLARVGRDAVVFVDTLNQAAPGADENSSKDMGAVLGNAKDLADRLDGLVILVHHAGKDKSRGMRGHSSLIAAMDAAIEVSSSSNGRSWQVAKARDDADGLSYAFELVPLIVGQDEDGLDVTSCAIGRTINPPRTEAKPPIRGKHQLSVMAKLNQLLCNSPNGVSFDDAVKKIAAGLDRPNERARTVARETIGKLARRGHLCLTEGWIALPKGNYLNPSDTEPP